MCVSKIYRTGCAVFILVALMANVAVAITNSDDIDAELMQDMDTYTPYGGRRLLASCNRSR